MNHKRRRPKHQRAGCLFCSPHKDERVKQRTKTSTRVLVSECEPERDIAIEVERDCGNAWDNTMSELEESYGWEKEYLSTLQDLEGLHKHAEAWLPQMEKT